MISTLRSRQIRRRSSSSDVGARNALAAPSGDAYENQASYFVDCVRNGRMPIAGSTAQARLAVMCAEAARQSLESGAVVAL